MESASDSRIHSVFKLDGLISTFKSDLDGVGAYADVLLHFPDGGSLHCVSSILSACASEAGPVDDAAAQTVAAVRNREGLVGAASSSLGKIIREYNVAAGTEPTPESLLGKSSFAEFMDTEKGLSSLLKTTQRSTDASTINSHPEDPDVMTIRLEEDEILWPSSKRVERREAAAPKVPSRKNTMNMQTSPALSKNTVAKAKSPARTRIASPGGALVPQRSTKGKASINNSHALASKTKTAAGVPKPTAERITILEKPVLPPFRVHKFILAMRILYYRQLMTVRGGMRFCDSDSNSSILPASVVSEFAMRCVIQYAYEPSKLGELFLTAEPHLLPYLKFTCRQYKSSGAWKGPKTDADADNKAHSRVKEPPVPIGTIKRLLELLKCAEYFCIEELADWCCRLLIDLGHGMEKCQGSFCARVVPRMLQELHGSREEIGYPGIGAVYDRAICFVARWPSKLWKRPLIECDDEVIEDILEEVNYLVSGDRKDERSRLRKSPPWLSHAARSENGQKSKAGGEDAAEYDSVVQRMKSLNLNSGIEHCFAFYLDVLQVRNAVNATSSSPKTSARWKAQLLQPAIECCLHVLAASFDHKVVVEGIMRLAGGTSALAEHSGRDQNNEEDDGVTQAPDISFNRTFASALLSQVTITSSTDWDPPLDKPILTDKTVGPLLRGLTRLVTLMPELQEAVEARVLVVNFLRRNWLTMSLRGFTSTSPFAKWPSEELDSLSRELQIPASELRGDKPKTRSITGSSTNRKSPAPVARKHTTSMRERLARNSKAQ